MCSMGQCVQVPHSPWHLGVWNTGIRWYTHISTQTTLQFLLSRGRWGLRPQAETGHSIQSALFHTLCKVPSHCIQLRSWMTKIPTGDLGLDRHGHNVHIKVVRSTSEELVVTEYLNSPALRSDKRNHTIPMISMILVGDWMLVVQAWWGSSWVMPA